MIDRNKTKEKYDYYPEELAPTSNLSVWTKCDKCGKEKDYSYAYALKKEEKARKENDGVMLCQVCSHSHRKGKASVVTKPKSWVALPPEVNVAKTVEMFGYDPTKLSPWSRKKIVVECAKTGVECYPRRCGLNRYKSVLETGHFYSTGALTAERRKGVKASSETKESMKLSQQKRRQKEKEDKKVQKQVEPPVWGQVEPRLSK